MHHEVAIPLALWKDTREQRGGARRQIVVLGAIAHMHRPQGNKLAQTNLVDCIRVPEAHGENTGIVGELDFEVALGGLVLFAGFGYVVEVHDAPDQVEVARAGFEGAELGFVVVEGGLDRVRCYVGEVRGALTVHGVGADAPAGCNAACTSSAVKPSLFFLGEEVKNDCMEDAGMMSLVRLLSHLVMIVLCWDVYSRRNAPSMSSICTFLISRNGQLLSEESAKNHG
jgi:hypothetical protein